MRYNQILEDLLGQKTKIKVLRFLSSNRDEFSGRHIANASGINHGQCHKVLNDLYREGVLNMRHMGNTYLYSLRQKNYLVEKIILPLFQAEPGLLKNLINELKRIKDLQIGSLILFGSVAQGKGKPRSDVDVLVVTAKKDNKIAEKILERNDYFVEKYGNSLSPYVVAEREFRERYQRGDKLIKNIVSDGTVISGKTIAELMG